MGDVFSIAFLIIPTFIALLVARSVTGVFILSTLVGGIIPPLAIFIAFKLDISSGPTAVVTALLVFLVVYAVKKIRQ